MTTDEQSYKDKKSNLDRHCKRINRIVSQTDQIL